MTFLSYLRHGTAAFQSGLSPYKFALFPHLLAFGAPKLDFPTWLKSGWSSLISTAISKVASVLLPRFISESWRNWAASAVVQTFASRVAYNIAFWPWFLLYRGADHYGYFNRWKTLPGRSNPNKELEAEMWDHVIHNLYRFPTVELAAWLLFYSRGEMAMETVPTLPAFLVKILIQIVSVDTIYYWFHRWEHRPENYARIHKRHHDIKITNVYGHLVDSPIETLCLFGMGIASNLIVAYTVGQDLFTSCGMTLFFITADLHIHCGYTVPFIPMNWWNVGRHEADSGQTNPTDSLSIRYSQPQYFHNAHHSENNTNYGAFFAIPLLSWDWWLGTDAGWKRYRDAGDGVRKHRNTWPGLAVEGDLEVKRNATVEEVGDLEGKGE